MRIRKTLMLTGGALVAAVALVFCALAWVAYEGQRTTDSQRASQEVARHIASLLNLTQEYTMYGSARPAIQWHARHAQLLAAIDEVPLTDGDSALELLKLKKQATELGSLFARYESAVGGTATAPDPDRRAFLQERLLAELQELVEVRYAWAQRVIAADERQQTLLGRTVLASLLVILLLAGVAGWTVHGQLLAPLRKLELATRGMSSAAKAGRSVTSADNELGDASRAVYEMADRLLDTQKQLRLIIDNVPALISLLDTSGKYVLVNRAYLDWDGRGLPDLVGHTMLEVHGPSGQARLQPFLTQALAGTSVTTEVELNRGGTSHAMQVTYVPSRDETGRVVGVYGLKTDVTAVRRAEERLRLMMDASPLGIFIRGVDGSLAYANPAWREQAGVSIEEAQQIGRAALIHPDDLEVVAGAFRDAAAGKELPPMEARYLHRDGKVVWVRAHLRLFERDGMAEGVLGLLEDITERRALDTLLAERTLALQRSNEDLERFAYVASHDLQEPLRMVTSYGQLLMRRHAGQLSDEAKEFLAFMVDGGQRAQTLVRDLLSLARLDSQAKPFVAVSLESVLSTSLNSLRDVVKRTKAEVTHSELPTVMGDAGQLAQLLTNLVSNGLKFSGPNPPRVHIAASRQGSAWQVSVKDHGIGIEPKFFERIFVMFQRLHLRSEHPGTGIGLAICKRVVERHGGRIWVESTPGQGAEFFFLLPDQPVEARAAAAPAQGHTAPIGAAS